MFVFFLQDGFDILYLARVQLSCLCVSSPARREGSTTFLLFCFPFFPLLSRSLCLSLHGGVCIYECVSEREREREREGKR